MIELRMLPGQDGDCLLLSYGKQALTHRILIDGGRTSTYPLVRSMLTQAGGIDLLVVTHVDQDHILGVLALLADVALPVTFGEVWFNGYDQLHDVAIETFGVKDGERLSTLLLARQLPWNTSFPIAAQDPLSPDRGGGAARCDKPPVELGGARLTVLSPDEHQLSALIPDWSVECGKEGLLARKPVRDRPVDEDVEQFGPLKIEALADEAFVADTSVTNPTSIAFMFEFEGFRLVFTGDADDSRIRRSLSEKVEREDGKIRIDALKVSHHGSRGNISKETLEMLDCGMYLISTNGSRHHHPHEVAMARILKYGGQRKELLFNYRGRADLWRDRDWQQQYGYTIRSPDAGRDGFLTSAWPAPG